ncbi:hypothetical protein A2U01_0020361 [Trifolium medium]|uniref:Uncharacterized protein n=1 Tax=Trifolium medium TaxID=97028 RepID=A0A392NJC2_9FABA|nr:hypothetical protein [Trifolium medium]
MASAPVSYSHLTGYRRASGILQCIRDLLQHEVQLLLDSPSTIDHFRELLSDLQESSSNLTFHQFAFLNMANMFDHLFSNKFGNLLKRKGVIGRILSSNQSKFEGKFPHWKPTSAFCPVVDLLEM